MEQGATEITVLPYFLAKGNHIDKDIPKESRTHKFAFPTLPFMSCHMLAKRRICLICCLDTYSIMPLGHTNHHQAMNEIYLYILLGSGSGILAGMLGVGGGQIIVPGLIYIFLKNGVSIDYLMHMAIAPRWQPSSLLRFRRFMHITNTGQ